MMPPTASTTMRSSRAIAATATAGPLSRPLIPTKINSRMPAPAGTGTARKPMIHAAIAANAIRAGFCS
jgi:hypothetical protein